MGLLDNHKPIWVQVSSAFINRVGPTTVSKFKRNNAFNYSKEAIKEVEYIYRKIIDMGYSPYDLVAQLKGKNEVIPIDIDMIVHQFIGRGNKLITRKKDKIKDLLISFGKLSYGMGQGAPVVSEKIFIELCQTLLQNKKEWTKEIQEAISNARNYANINL